MEYLITNNILVEYMQSTISKFLDMRIRDIFLPKYDLFLIFLYTLGWTALYMVIHVSPFKHSTKKHTLDTKNRIVSIIHATLILFMSLYDYFYLQEDKCGNTNSDYQNNMMLISCSYFIYDLLACQYFNVSDVGMTVHHVFVIIAEYSCLVMNNSATELVRGFIAAELSNPVMHLRTITGNFGLKHSKLFILFESYYFTSYAFARLVFGFQVSIFTVLCWENVFLVKFSAMVVWLQSWIYVINMINIVKRRIKEYKERKHFKIPFWWFEFNPKLSTLSFVKHGKGEKYVP